MASCPDGVGFGGVGGTKLSCILWSAVGNLLGFSPGFTAPSIFKGLRCELDMLVVLSCMRISLGTVGLVIVVDGSVELSQTEFHGSIMNPADFGHFLEACNYHGIAVPNAGCVLAFTSSNVQPNPAAQVGMPKSKPSRYRFQKTQRASPKHKAHKSPQSYEA